jgi:hypothetical protein
LPPHKGWPEAGKPCRVAQLPLMNRLAYANIILEYEGRRRFSMWTPLAIIILVIGAVNTPAMIDAEREYLQSEPVIEIQDIQTSQMYIDHADRLVGE